jgi:hypothetical protein
MAKGSTIIISGEARGRFEWGIIGDTSKPGTVMQISAGIPAANGRFTWVASASGTDGNDVLLAVLMEDYSQGKQITDAYVAGTFGQLYFVQPGDETNQLCGEVAGTGNSYTVGDRLIVDADTGILVPSAGTPQAAVAIVLETVVQQAAPVLLWVKWL